MRSGHVVKAAVARGSLLVVVCFQERGEISVSPRLLPPGKPSVSVRLVRRRDAEDLDAKVGGDLEAHACTVACEIQEGDDHSDPENYVFVNKAVEVLVEEEEARPDEGRVGEAQLTLCHVGDHQLVGELGDDHPEGEQVQAGVMLEQLARRLLVDDEGQREEEADVRTRTQHAGVSHSGAIFANTSVQDDVEIVVAGVESSSDDAHDGEVEQLQSKDGQRCLPKSDASESCHHVHEDDGELDLCHIDQAKAESPRHVRLPVSAEEHKHPDETAEENPVWVPPYSTGNARSHGDKHCRDGVTAVVKKLPEG